MTPDTRRRLKEISGDLDRLMWWNEPGYDGPTTTDLAQALRNLVEVLLSEKGDADDADVDA